MIQLGPENEVPIISFMATFFDVHERWCQVFIIVCVSREIRDTSSFAHK